MAYNGKNKLIRVKQVQDLYTLHHGEGVTTRYIYKKFIEPRFNISMATLYNYLSINAKKELREMGMTDEEIKSIGIHSVDQNQTVLNSSLTDEIRSVIKDEISNTNQMIATIGTMIA